MKINIIPSFIVVISCILASPASSGIWSDGFEAQQLKGWELASSPGPTTIKIEKGELSVEVHSGWISYLRIIDSDQWKDYTMTVKVNILQTFGNYVDGGVMVRESLYPSDQTDHYYFFIADNWITQPYPGVPPEGEGAFVFPFINGVVKKGQAKVFTPKLDHWYTLAVVARGDHIEFYVDRDLVGVFDYAEIQQGSVGLVDSNAHVHFDDFVITGSDIPDGGPGGASISVNRENTLSVTWGIVKQDH